MAVPTAVGDERVSPDPRAVPDVAESVARELAAVFDRLAPEVVMAVVREAEHDLAGQVADGPFAELLHRLGACRLAQLQAGLDDVRRTGGRGSVS
jgi:hypothetical protein